MPGADILRIISGFGVVMIHVTDPFLVYPPYLATGGTFWWLYFILNTAFRFSVPVFIMLSGYLLLASPTRSYGEFYRKRFLRVGIPAAFWIIFYLAWWYFLGKVETPFELIVAFTTVSLEHLYFIFIIVELYFIAPMLMIFNKGASEVGKRVFAISATVFTILVATSGVLVPEAYVGTATNVFAIFVPFISYFYLGYFFRNVKLSLTQSIWIVNLFLNAVLITVVLSSGDLFSYFRQYASPTVLIMSVTIFTIFLQAQIWKKVAQNARAVSVLKNVSGCIFGIYLVHMLILNIVDIYFPLTPENIITPIWGWVGVKVALVFGASYLMVLIGKRIPKVGIIFG